MNNHNKYRNTIILPERNYKIKFLHSLHKTTLSQLSDYQKKIFESQLGELEPIVNEFIQKGYMKNPTFLDSLNNAMSVVKLKEFLKSKNEKASGNKQELLIRAADFLSNEEKEKIIETNSIYRLTEIGWDLVNNDRNRFELEVKIFEQEIIYEVCNNEIDSALQILSSFFASSLFPIGMGVNWNDGFPLREKAIVNHIINSHFLNESTNISHQDNLELRSIIAVDYLFYMSGFSYMDISEKILSRFPDFMCPVVENFLRNEPTGVFKYYDAKNINDVIRVFSHTIKFEAINKIVFDECSNNQSMEWCKGITILAGKDDCSLCSGRNTNYKWSELNTISKLPRYPGCVCSYACYMAK